MHYPRFFVLSLLFLLSVGTAQADVTPAVPATVPQSSPAPEVSPAKAETAKPSPKSESRESPNPAVVVALIGQDAPKPPSQKTATVPPSLSSNGTFFPPTLFPSLQHYSDVDFMLAGMAAVYPGRVVRGKTNPVPPVGARLPRPPVQDVLPGKVEYIRCYSGSLANAAELPLPATANRIVDLRYLATAPEDASACATLCERLTGARPHYRAQGRYPRIVAAPDAPLPPPPAPMSATRAGVRTVVLVLVNGGTSGPIEAMLADLQMRRKILLVGASTAGRTAHLEELPGYDGWWRIVGEIQPEERSTSLVATGVAPDASIPTTPEGDLLAWQRVEKGERPAALLRPIRGENPTSGNTKSVEETPPESGSPDLILRRAHDLINALSSDTVATADSAPVL